MNLTTRTVCAFGALFGALSLCLFPLTATAQYSTAYGQGALASNTRDANANSAFGIYTLGNNTSGYSNTAAGGVEE